MSTLMDLTNGVTNTAIQTAEGFSFGALFKQHWIVLPAVVVLVYSIFFKPRPGVVSAAFLALGIYAVRYFWKGWDSFSVDFWPLPIHGSWWDYVWFNGSWFLVFAFSLSALLETFIKTSIAEILGKRRNR